MQGWVDVRRPQATKGEIVWLDVDERGACWSSAPDEAAAARGGGGGGGGSTGLAGCCGESSTFIRFGARKGRGAGVSRVSLAEGGTNLGMMKAAPAARGTTGLQIMGAVCDLMSRPLREVSGKATTFPR